MRYVVLTAKHVSGFCIGDSKVQWQGREYDYDVASGEDSTNVIAAFIRACKKYDTWPGVYYCAMDLRNSLREIVWYPELPALSEDRLYEPGEQRGHH